MEKSQLDNLINIAFLFHRQMDNQWMDLNNDYIIEKWNKIIGTKSNKSVFMPEDDNVLMWKTKWFINLEEYDQVKQILSFIRQLNIRPIFVYRESTDNYLLNNNWRPDDLVKLYKNNIGDPNLISKEYYGHIHALVKNAIQFYKSMYLREYNLTLLV